MPDHFAYENGSLCVAKLITLQHRNNKQNNKRNEVFESKTPKKGKDILYQIR